MHPREKFLPQWLNFWEQELAEAVKSLPESPTPEAKEKAKAAAVESADAKLSALLADDRKKAAFALEGRFVKIRDATGHLPSYIAEAIKANAALAQYLDDGESCAEAFTTLDIATKNLMQAVAAADARLDAVAERARK